MRCFINLPMSVIIMFIALITSNKSFSQQLGDLSFSYPGGVVELILPKNSSVLPSVQFGIREPIIIDQKDHWRVIIGLDSNTLPGDYLVYVKYLDSKEPAYNVKFRVNQKNFPITELDAEPSISIQHNRLSDLDFSNSEQPTFPLEPPIAGQWNDAFGHKQYNAESKTDIPTMVTQNFVSITTDKTTIISSPSNAIVSRIAYSDEPSPLATIYLDHGRGLYSIISGVSDLSVSIGDGILGGAVIGKVSQDKNELIFKQLKWQCLINGVYVNPLILTQL